ncbi:hypothetical protein [Streptomyces sp. NPDC059909]|uniref:hypothetical protein n=1 Tax=Streptomyces sp. NPDC059909 TaxID=3346998 RepID=UPI00364863F2
MITRTAGFERDPVCHNALSKDTIADRLLAVRRFQRFTNEWPWTWRPTDVEEYTAHLRSDGRQRSHSTIRGYHGHVRLFLEYVADPRYEWTAVSERLFGSHPAQVFFEWNTAVHAAEYEGRPGRRALTKAELQRYADDQVAAARTSGRQGWLPAMRDATAMKATYAWGLRRREVIKLDLADFGHNPHAPEFGEFGACPGGRCTSTALRRFSVNPGSRPWPRAPEPGSRWSAKPRRPSWQTPLE